jgi:Flp pilus assembly protein TadB
VSKERARRRAEREHEAQLKVESRRREEQRRARARSRKQALTGWIPRPHVTPGIVAARRRNELWATFSLLLLLNVLVWLVRPDWAARLGALVVSLVVFPVVRLMVSRK